MQKIIYTNKLIKTLVSFHICKLTFRFVNNTENFDPETLYIFYGKHTAFKLDTLNPADEIGDEIMDPVVNIVI